MEGPELIPNLVCRSQVWRAVSSWNIDIEHTEKNRYQEEMRSRARPYEHSVTRVGRWIFGESPLVRFQPLRANGSDYLLSEE